MRILGSSVHILASSVRILGSSVRILASQSGFGVVVIKKPHYQHLMKFLVAGSTFRFFRFKLFSKNVPSSVSSSTRRMNLRMSIHGNPDLQRPFPG